MFSHTIGRLTFADKHIRANGERGLPAGIHMANENNNQHSRAGFSKTIQSHIGRIIGEQIPIHQQHVHTTDRRLNQRGKPIRGFADYFHIQIEK
jgi:hypothetical protein